MSTHYRLRAQSTLAAVMLFAALPLQAQTLPDRIFRHRMEPRPVSGQLVINGFPMPFPSGSIANGAQQASPGVYSGVLYFPPSSVQSNVNGLGMVTLTLQLIHLGSTYNPIVAPNVAGIQMDNVYLQLQSATVSGVPVALGSDCIYGPIVIGVTGTWNASAETMSGGGITIPPIANSAACAGFATTLNNSIAGTNNSATITITF
ncbi:hypothetical protein [Tahibacter sp.]|uniref:hypothetical protein n=1 Tax=Tahibacter sp. TaxID=2056211 RepID=UPI0028C3F5B4|nr:hypothetical protein [Tahibacter sp.]